MPELNHASQKSRFFYLSAKVKPLKLKSEKRSDNRGHFEQNLPYLAKPDTPSEEKKQGEEKALSSFNEYESTKKSFRINKMNKNFNIRSFSTNPIKESFTNCTSVVLQAQVHQGSDQQLNISSLLTSDSSPIPSPQKSTSVGEFISKNNLKAGQKT